MKLVPVAWTLVVASTSCGCSRTEPIVRAGETAATTKAETRAAAPSASNGAAPTAPSPAGKIAAGDAPSSPPSAECSAQNPLHATLATGALRLRPHALLGYNSGDPNDRGFGPGWTFALADTLEVVATDEGTRAFVHQGFDTYVLPIRYQGAYPFWPTQRAGYRATVRGKDVLIERGNATNVAVYREAPGGGYRIEELKAPYDLARYEYDSRGLLTRVSHTNSCFSPTTLQRDSSGLVEQITFTIRGAPATSTFRYVRGSPVWVQTTEGGRVTTLELTYGADHRLASVRESTAAAGTEAGAKPTPTTYGYDVYGRVAEIRSPNSRVDYRYRVDQLLRCVPRALHRPMV